MKHTNISLKASGIRFDILQRARKLIASDIASSGSPHPPKTFSKIQQSAPQTPEPQLSGPTKEITQHRSSQYKAARAQQVMQLQAMQLQQQQLQDLLLQLQQQTRLQQQQQQNAAQLVQQQALKQILMKQQQLQHSVAQIQSRTAEADPLVKAVIPQSDIPSSVSATVDIHTVQQTATSSGENGSNEEDEYIPDFEAEEDSSPAPVLASQTVKRPSSSLDRLQSTTQSVTFAAPISQAKVFDMSASVTSVKAKSAVRERPSSEVSRRQPSQSTKLLKHNSDTAEEVKLRDSLSILRNEIKLLAQERISANRDYATRMRDVARSIRSAEADDVGMDPYAALPFPAPEKIRLTRVTRPAQHVVPLRTSLIRSSRNLTRTKVQKKQLSHPTRGRSAVALVRNILPASARASRSVSPDLRRSRSVPSKRPRKSSKKQKRSLVRRSRSEERSVPFANGRDQSIDLIQHAEVILKSRSGAIGSPPTRLRSIVPQGRSQERKLPSNNASTTQIAQEDRLELRRNQEHIEQYLRHLESQQQQQQQMWTTAIQHASQVAAEQAAARVTRLTNATLGQRLMQTMAKMVVANADGLTEQILDQVIEETVSMLMEMERAEEYQRQVRQQSIEIKDVMSLLERVEIEEDELRQRYQHIGHSAQHRDLPPSLRQSLRLVEHIKSSTIVEDTRVVIHPPYENSNIHHTESLGPSPVEEALKPTGSGTSHALSAPLEEHSTWATEALLRQAELARRKYRVYQTYNVGLAKAPVDHEVVQSWTVMETISELLLDDIISEVTGHILTSSDQVVEDLLSRELVSV